jgi:hypothetical protein
MNDDWGNDPIKTGTPPSTGWGDDPIKTGSPPASAPKFPFDDLHYSYGNILPFRGKVDERGNPVPGSLEFAAPEIIRSPARGLVDLNARLHSPVGYQAPLTPDELGVVAGVAGTGFSPATNAERLIPKAPPEVPPVGGITRARALDIAKDVGVTAKATSTVEKRAAQDISAGNTTAADVIENLNKGRSSGKPLMLPDVLGANVTGEAGRVARVPGQSKEIVEQAFRARNLDATGRLTSDINKTLGQTGAYQARADLEAARRTAATPKYDAAFSRIVPTAEEAARVERFIRDPIGQDALQKGMRVIQLEKLAKDERFNPADYGVVRGDDGKYQLEAGVPNLRLMDAVKRGYDEIVEGFRDPTSGRLNLNQYGLAVNQVRATYTGELRQMYPRYAAALNAWGGPSQSIDALKFGESALTNAPEVNAARLQSMSENDREFAKLGIAQRLRDIANSKGPLAAEFDRLAGTKYGSTAVRDKIRPFFSSDEELQRLVDGVDYEIKIARKSNEILAGSQTAQRVAEDMGVSGSDVAHAALSAGMGHYGSVARQVMSMLGKFLPKDDPEVAARIAKILTDPTLQPTIGPDGRLMLPSPAPSVMSTVSPARSASAGLGVP